MHSWWGGTGKAVHKQKGRKKIILGRILTSIKGKLFFGIPWDIINL
jgi:hypothetical protein